MDEPRRELRIGDRERRAVDAHLSRAHADGALTATEYDERVRRCRAARTSDQLDELVRDLAAHPPGPAGGLERHWWGRLLARGLPVLFLAGVAFGGVQVAGADDGVVILGSRDIVVGPEQHRVEVGVIEGTVRVVVPEGVQARTTKEWAGSRISCGDACRRPGPVVVVHLIGTGSVEVLTGEELADSGH